MALTQAQKRHLRGLGHSRKPVVWIGQHGVTDGVRRELETALGAHELIKVSVRVGDRDKRDALIDELASALKAELVQRIGNIVALYRAHPKEPRLILPGH
jgi:RNA-binding protein